MFENGWGWVKAGTHRSYFQDWCNLLIIFWENLFWSNLWTTRTQVNLMLKRENRKMRFKYTFHGKNREVQPFHVKSDWNLPVQPSVAKDKTVFNRKRKERNRNKGKMHYNNIIESHIKHIWNPSNEQLTDEQITLLSRGLKFIPTPVTTESNIRRELLRGGHWGVPNTAIP